MQWNYWLWDEPVVTAGGKKKDEMQCVPPTWNTALIK